MNFGELRGRASQGDPGAQDELSRVLDAHPEIWRRVGDLAAHAQLEFTRLIAKGDFLLSESVRRKAEEMQRELQGVFATPLEIVAAQRVVAAWLQVQHVEAQIAVADGEVTKAKFWLQRQLQANRLLHAATKSLLLIRELLPPGAPPAAITANGTSDTGIRRDGRMAASANGKASRHSEPDAVPANRINGAAKNGKRELATV